MSCFTSVWWGGDEDYTQGSNPPLHKPREKKPFGYVPNQPVGTCIGPHAGKVSNFHQDTAALKKTI